MADSKNLNRATTELSNRLCQAREMIGLSRSQLARRIGVHPSAAIQWEKEGGTHPSTAHLIHISILTNVAFDWLATGRGSPRRQHDTLSRESIAIDLFEETLLKLVRSIPMSARAPLLGLLKSFNESSRVGNGQQ